MIDADKPNQPGWDFDIRTRSINSFNRSRKKTSSLLSQKTGLLLIIKMVNCDFFGTNST